MELEAYHFVLPVPFIPNPVLGDQQLSDSRGIADVDLNLTFHSPDSAFVRLLAAPNTLVLECRVWVSGKAGMVQGGEYGPAVHVRPPSAALTDIIYKSDSGTRRKRAFAAREYATRASEGAR